MALALDSFSKAGEAASVNGEASIDQKRLDAGATIHVGSVIQTGAGGSVKVLLLDKTIVDIGEKSHFIVEQFRLKQLNNREAVVALKLGSARLLITKKLDRSKGKFHIKTKASVLAVRGTELIVTTSDGTTYRERIVVASGNVERQTEGPTAERVELGPGRALESEWTLSGDTYRPEGGNAGVPNPVDAGEVRRQVETYTVQDQTFQQYTVIGDEGTPGHRNHGRDTLKGTSETLTITDSFPAAIEGDRHDVGSGDSLTAPPALDYLTVIGRDNASGGNARIRVRFQP